MADHRDEIIICKQEDNIRLIVVGISDMRGEVNLLNNRINGSMDKIAAHVEEGVGYRKLILGTALSLIMAILGGIVTTWIVTSQLGYTMGQFAKQIQVNTEWIAEHRRLTDVIHTPRN